jgi:hypothetical protein
VRVVRHNLVHDNVGQEGDCLKFMYGVYASIFEDNVMYNCPRGVSTESENYGITSYGSGAVNYTIAADDNIVPETSSSAPHRARRATATSPSTSGLGRKC